MGSEPDAARLAQPPFADGARLVADIGATHARFALQAGPGVFTHVALLKCDDFDGIVPLLRFYLTDHAGLTLQHAALAVANPVGGDQVRMTNRAWEFSTDAVRRELGLARMAARVEQTPGIGAGPGADLSRAGPAQWRGRAGALRDRDRRRRAGAQ
jgi:glucokinase